MAFQIIFLEEFGKSFVPKKIIPNLRRYMLKAGFDEVPYKFFGILFYITLSITLLLFISFIFPYISARKYPVLLISLYSFSSWFVVQLFFAAFFIMLVYFYLDLRIYHRTRLMEEQLPDFLEVLSANLKGGMTFERALWGAINPRFRVLSNEIAKTSKKVMTGYDLSKALIELGDNYDSLMLKRTMDLIISEVESGGNVANLIDRLVDNLKETKELKDEMAASAIAYIIFISVIVIVISPLLFALSFHLLKVLVSFMNKLSSTTQNVRALPFVFSKVRVNVEDFRIFSMIALFVISLFSSLIVAIVEKGQIKAGIKYIPIYVIGSTIFYFIFMKVLGSVLGGIV
ncbi:MAG TPA: type II secretion system F family protein [Candidatus Nanoarchaeia archaeon]|nr:type II secretion system F family protein [Candidatus Nanoarchaeia archaeon]